MNSRIDGRSNDELRPINVTRNYISHAEGSVFIEVGKTRVICTATIEEKVPQFQKGKGLGWVTAEYDMIPRSTQVRIIRPQTIGKIGGRTHEIQRLIGRSLRGVVDFKKLGERTIWIDCDVIEADGGTRCAAITGGFVALYDCCRHLVEQKIISEMPVSDFLAAISVGIVNGEIMADLCFAEDSTAEVDMNVVMNSQGNLIEVQSTAEYKAFSREDFNKLLDLSVFSIEKLFEVQKMALFEK
ncbi:MAG: ribonuclease PH [Actinobacteria bacterium]|jgi:ribonuclease PH|nr:ribonuclease PH [Actinomycetota bacterium]